VILTTGYMQCSWCKHKHEWTREKAWSCAAFPDGKGIPREIYNNQHIHTEPYPGDNGILFELREGADPGERLPFRTSAEIRASIHDAMQEAERENDPVQTSQDWRETMDKFADAWEMAGGNAEDYRTMIEAKQNGNDDFEAFKRWKKEYEQVKNDHRAYSKFVEILGDDIDRCFFAWLGVNFSGRTSRAKQAHL